MGSCDNHPEVSPQLIYRLLQDLGSAVMAVDSERRILFINKQARNLLGIGDRDLSQVPISELASSGEISTLRSIVGALDTALIDRRTFQRELLTVETTDRGIRTIACNVTPLYADSGDLGRPQRSFQTSRKSTQVNAAGWDLSVKPISRALSRGWHTRSGIRWPPSGCTLRLPREMQMNPFNRFKIPSR